MTIRKDEVGKIIRVNALFDMTNNSELTLIFTKPDLTTLTVNKASGVSAPGVDVLDPVTGVTFNANEYFQYTTQAGNIDQSGSWKIKGVYDDLTPKHFIGDTDVFTVLG